MDELLAKYMIGEATPAEMELVANWVKESEYNEKYFAHFKLIWETAQTLQRESSLNVDDSWAEFKQLTQKLEDRQVESTAGPLIVPLPNRWLKIAAIWGCVIGLAGLFYIFQHPAKPEILTFQTTDTVKTDTLSDGSLITLNKNSLLTYPSKFSGNTRELSLLSGEAFFSIAHDRTKPFLVHINNVVVKVVGTSFNIRNDKQKAQILVETGIVEVIRAKVVIRLKPTEMVDIDYKSGAVKKGLSRDSFYNYYRTKEFKADKTPLWRVAEVLNQIYGVNIQIPDQALANRTLTTTLRLGALDPVLELIASTFKVRIIHEPGQIIIK